MGVRAVAGHHQLLGFVERGRNGKLIECLRWYTTHGERIAWYEAIEQDTGKTPGPLLTRPTLEPHLFFYWSAFWDLSSSRSVGMGLSAIPVSEVLAYSQLMHIEDVGTRQRLLHVVQALDAEYLKLAEKRSKQKQPQAPARRGMNA